MNRVSPKLGWFLAFTASFAVLAGFVFWGTWGLSACPVMPDARMSFPASGYVAEWLRGWVGNGKFVPWDITVFLGSPYLWQELQYALAAYFAALGLAYYLRGRGLSRVSCYGAGLLLGFCGYWLTLFSAGHAGWFRWMTYGVFAFGLADRAVRKGKAKSWALLGACLAWGSFYQPDLWLIFTVFTGAYFVWCCVRERRLPCWKGLLLSAIVFFAIGAPSFRSAIVEDMAGRDKQIAEGQTVSEKSADDAEKRWIFVTNWSLPPAETLEFFIPRLNGDTSCPSTLGLGSRQGTGVKPYTGALGRPINATQGNYRQHALYVGWVTCLLALLAVAALFLRSGERPSAALPAKDVNRREIAFFAVAALVFWLFSMGRYCAPVYRVVYSLPFGDYLRAPVKWHHITELCLCALAGFGLEALLRQTVSSRLSRRVPAAAVVASVALLGACDLARVDRFYCAAIDLSVVQARNPAADEILKRGGGKVVDLLEGGNGIVSWSFGARKVEMTANLGDPSARFIWATVDQLNNKGLATWTKAKKAVPVGAYTVTQKAIRATDGRTANVMLLEVPGVPPSPPAETPVPPVTLATWLGMLSAVCTLSVAAYGVAKS